MRFVKFTCTNIDPAVARRGSGEPCRQKARATDVCQTANLRNSSASNKLDKLMRPLQLFTFQISQFVFTYRHKIIQNNEAVPEKECNNSETPNKDFDSSVMIHLSPQVFVVVATLEETLIPALRHRIALSAVAMVSVPSALTLLWISQKNSTWLQSRSWIPSESHLRSLEPQNQLVRPTAEGTQADYFIQLTTKCSFFLITWFKCFHLLFAGHL